MTADEIRKHWNVVGGPGQYPPELISDFALVEIAAQLAELVALLRSFSTGAGAAGDTLDVRIIQT